MKNRCHILSFLSQQIQQIFIFSFYFGQKGEGGERGTSFIQINNLFWEGHGGILCVWGMIPAQIVE